MDLYSSLAGQSHELTKELAQWTGIHAREWIGLPSVSGCFKEVIKPTMRDLPLSSSVSTMILRNKHHCVTKYVSDYVIIIVWVAFI